MESCQSAVEPIAYANFERLKKSAAEFFACRKSPQLRLPGIQKRKD
jgi:hypothetical protein